MTISLHWRFGEPKLPQRGKPQPPRLALPWLPRLLFPSANQSPYQAQSARVFQACCASELVLRSDQGTPCCSKAERIRKTIRSWLPRLLPLALLPAVAHGTMASVHLTAHSVDSRLWHRRIAFSRSGSPRLHASPVLTRAAALLAHGFPLAGPWQPGSGSLALYGAPLPWATPTASQQRGQRREPPRSPPRETGPGTSNVPGIPQAEAPTIASSSASKHSDILCRTPSLFPRCLSHLHAQSLRERNGSLVTSTVGGLDFIIVHLSKKSARRQVRRRMERADETRDHARGGERTGTVSALHLGFDRHFHLFEG
jgi:hypothetical protein